MNLYDPHYRMEECIFDCRGVDEDEDVILSDESVGN